MSKRSSRTGTAETPAFSRDDVRLALRPREAARALGVSQRHLHGLVHDGLIPHVRLGRALLFPIGPLQEFLKREAAKHMRASKQRGGRHDRTSK